ncbi:carbonic anhydrase [Actinacidiphila soli]|uniref:carbonic anhydrase n=1 Tax=Actinacidiphila soli TaxID=2487275 RepID=UPI000FC9A077|nr:carbonic anhydrase [Actinacidiphila soli]
MTGAEHLLSRRHHVGAALTPLDPEKRRPLTRVAIVACMDARLGIETMFGLRAGDAHVIRNAGGCITSDTLRSLRLSQIRGGTREIVLVHHEDCAALSDPDADLRECLDLLRTSNELPHTDVVRGFIYTRGGALREIRPDRRAE